jgi:hypothetical protein
MSTLPKETHRIGEASVWCSQCGERSIVGFTFTPKSDVAAWDLDDAAQGAVRGSWCRHCDTERQIEAVREIGTIEVQPVELFELVYQLPSSGEIVGFGPYPTREAAEQHAARIATLGARILRIGRAVFPGTGPLAEIRLGSSWKQSSH